MGKGYQRLTVPWAFIRTGERGSWAAGLWASSGWGKGCGSSALGSSKGQHEEFDEEGRQRGELQITLQRQQGHRAVL
ncbi:unnamed protein product [Linum trigynum]|uniref:Uncharacterized protein n=1 Tax=Linum trigynum TaxID=586398 RepID=A0AAV2GD80_9ROSI